ncbi:MAG: ATP-dependent DNA helicase [Rhodospirillales bacterium]|nr:ATP-dependent DNA helicase [Rhodospirillales bacterium]
MRRAAGARQPLYSAAMPAPFESRESSPPPATLPLPRAPALVVAPRHAVWLDEDGVLARLSHQAARERLAAAGPAPYVCHAKAIVRRLGLSDLVALDVLELFAFVHPARLTVPTVRGLARALGLTLPESTEDEAATLQAATARLLGALASPGLAGARDAPAIARTMARAGWPWGDAALAALKAGGRTPAGAGRPDDAGPLAVWTRLKEWQESAPPAALGHDPVAPGAARKRLAHLLGDGAEPRPEQADYASAACAAFDPMEAEERPHVVLAEAGTGVGKTLGYIAPASLWAERNEGTVWLSTFTRNLQRQIDQELDRLYPEPRAKAEKVVLRKGRENYFCLLNMEEAVGRSALVPAERIALGLMARWAAATRDGDLTGGDLPAWLADLLGYGRTLGLADRRGECIHGACTHYRRCFIEKSQRKARRADMVIANHALLMVQAARAAFGTGDERGVPTRYVLDEGHHLFDAADSAFSAHLSGSEARELRRWLLGPETRGRSGAGRARGLSSRIGDLTEGREAAAEALETALTAARALPGNDWHPRLAGGSPQGPCERFLALVREQVLARAPEPQSGYSIEAPVAPLIPGLADAAAALESALADIARPLGQLAAALAVLLDQEAESLESTERQRIEAVVRGIERRASEQLGAWQSMLQDMRTAPVNDDELAQDDVAPDPAGFVDWFQVSRIEGRDVDVGMHRHYVDPTIAFSEFVTGRAHGALITSATLRDGTGDEEQDWAAAEAATGGRHLKAPAIRAALPSPFDYGEQTRVLVVTDVRRGAPDRIAAAYRALFTAAGGGALGLFTAIARLRAVHERIAGALDEAGIALWAQHVDPLDTTTLVDIFRSETDACLLGTDAVRDGIDVPGESLRLIVFERVPWPRPDILHKARRRVFGGGRYDDRLTRARLRQAYGRLVRRADDRGVFVLLDPALPSRLAGAFPPGVTVERVGLAEAVEITRAFVRSERQAQ